MGVWGAHMGVKQYQKIFDEDQTLLTNTQHDSTGTLELGRLEGGGGYSLFNFLLNFDIQVMASKRMRENYHQSLPICLEPPLTQKL